jgi:hypothetical protein
MTNTSRGSMASGWVEQLQGATSGAEPFLVRGPRRGAFVVESGHRRKVSSGLLLAALAEAFGPARAVNAAEFDSWSDGPPVEVLEGPRGAPFVIVGGRRLPIHGLPLPHPVDKEAMERFPEGPELDLASANVPRASFERAVAGKYQVGQARAVIEREGVLHGTQTLARRAARRLRHR